MPKSGPPRASWVEAQSRAEEICADFDRWRAEIDAAKTVVGLSDLEEETSRLGKEVGRLEREIAGATATTLAGLRVKALVAKEHLEEEDDWAGLFSGLHRDVLTVKDAPAAASTGPQIDFGAVSMPRLRQLPGIRQRPPVPSLGDLVALLGVSYDAWRLRRINAGLQRAVSRGDDPAVARLVSRGEKALADMETGRRIFARKRASPHSG